MLLTCRPLAVVTTVDYMIKFIAHTNIVHEHVKSINPSSVTTEIYWCFYVLNSARHAFWPNTKKL